MPWASSAAFLSPEGRKKSVSGQQGAALPAVASGRGKPREAGGHSLGFGFSFFFFFLLEN